MTNVTNIQVAKAQRIIAAFVSLILGRKVTVIWGKFAACTDTGDIMLPRPKTGNAEEVALLTRLGLHEAGHAMHTDFSVLDGISPQVKNLLNSLEDPRIEKAQVDAFKGASLILNRGLEAAFQVCLEVLSTDNPDNRSRWLALNVVLRGYMRMVPHPTIHAMGPDIVATADSVLGEKLVKPIEDAIDQLPQCRNTSDVRALANWLWNALQEAAKPQPPQEQEQAPSDPSDPSGDEVSEDSQQSGGADQVPQDPASQDAEQSQEQEDAQPSPTEDDSAQVQQPGQSADGGPKDADSNAQADDQGQQDPTATNPDGDSPTGEGEAGSEDSANEVPGAEQNAQDVPQEPQGQDDSTPESDSSSGVSSAAGNELNAGESTASGGTPESDVQPGAGEPQGEGNGAQQSDDAGGQAQNGGEAEQAQPTEQPGTMDLDGLPDMDMGELLKAAYQAQFGEQDVDSDPNAAEEKSQATEAQTAVVAKALEKALDQGDSLEQAMEEADQGLEALEVVVAQPGQPDAGSEAEPQEQQCPKAGASSGKASASGTSANAETRLTGVVSRLVRVFIGLLQDKRRRPVKYAKAGGQIATNRAWRLKRMGDTNVFRVRTPVAGIDAAVMILLDRSSSMEDVIGDVASVCLASAQAFERISKVKTAIEMFPGIQWRTEATVTLQKFGESARKAVSRAETVYADGGTPLAEAMQDAVPKLLAQRVQKHLLIVVTDGEPADKVAAAKQIASAQALGVEVIGIGMGSECEIEQLIPYSVHIDEVSKLPEGLEALFKDHIVDRLAA